MKLLRYLAMALMATTLPAMAGTPAQINGAGSTFIYPILSQWAIGYHEKTGAKINYQAIGSGGGIRQIIKNTVAFAATDAPLSEAELKKHKLLQFPMVMGGVIPVVNLPGIKANQLRLDGETLAALFAGKITQWNDPRIQALNPDLKLPDQKVTVVHRADGSGTTWIFTNYLTKVSPTWANSIGNAKAVSWPTGVGAKGNAAVANYVERIKGGIGYVELAYVLQNKMTSVSLKNSAGNFVAPTLDTLKAAAANADWKNTPGLAVILTNQPGANSWPITGATFMLLHAPLASNTNQVLRTFFSWCWSAGKAKAEALHYVPLPASLVQQIESGWQQAAAQ